MPAPRARTTHPNGGEAAWRSSASFDETDPVTTSSITIERSAGVALLRMAHGKANALDLSLCHQLIAALGEIERADDRAVVLTGTGGIFSAGVDLLQIRDGGTAYLKEFLPALSDVFLTLFDFPRPVVAAVNGHAIAGGAVLAAACDHRLMNAERGTIGVTELLVGVPFPLVATEILRCAYGAGVARLAFFGQTYPATEAAARNLVDETVAPDAVVTRALSVAGTLGAVPVSAFAHTKAQLHRPFDERIGENRVGDDERVLELWSSAEAAAAIDAYVRSVVKSG